VRGNFIQTVTGWSGSTVRAGGGDGVLDQGVERGLQALAIGEHLAVGVHLDLPAPRRRDHPALERPRDQVLQVERGAAQKVLLLGTDVLLIDERNRPAGPCNTASTRSCQAGASATATSAALSADAAGSPVVAKQ
jgi:hypothetical protein